MMRVYELWYAFILPDAFCSGRDVCRTPLFLPHLLLPLPLPLPFPCINEGAHGIYLFLLLILFGPQFLNHNRKQIIASAFARARTTCKVSS